MIGISAIIEHTPYLGIFALLILGGIGFPFPEDTTLILSGVLVSHGFIKPLRALFVIYLGLLISDSLLYWVGKKYGRRVVEHKRFRKFISSEKLLKLEEKFRRWGVFVIILGRHLIGLRAQIFLVAGVMKMHPIKFLIADAATALLTVAIMGGIGYVGGNSIQILKKDVTRIEHIAIVVAILLFASGIVIWNFKSRKVQKYNFKQISNSKDDPSGIG
jgi:membrane protein DedA with SNARE-associated domain